MRGTAALLLLGLAACNQEETASPTETKVAIAPAAPQSTVAGSPSATKPSLLAVPEDKSALQRMIDLGYTVHDEHLHPPGAKECPLMSADVVQ